MFNFLHTYNPEPILISLGPVNIYWYGLFIVTGILAGIMVVLKVAEKYDLPKNKIIDTIFWLVISGVIGARLYHVLLEFPFYLEHPLSIFAVWQGGLAIHGGLFAGGVVSIILAKRYKINYWLLLAIYTPGVALAQAIGRWGNYFNQELFGKPTDLPWGIPIEVIHRVGEYLNSEFFHPTFLYESIGNFLIFAGLLACHAWLIKNKNNFFQLCVIAYLMLYSLLRFSLEFIRVDITPEFFGLRWPQIVSLWVIAFNLLYLVIKWPKLKQIEKT